MIYLVRIFECKKLKAEVLLEDDPCGIEGRLMGVGYARHPINYREITHGDNFLYKFADDVEISAYVKRSGKVVPMGDKEFVHWAIKVLNNEDVSTAGETAVGTVL